MYFFKSLLIDVMIALSFYNIVLEKKKLRQSTISIKWCFIMQKFENIGDYSLANKTRFLFKPIN